MIQLTNILVPVDFSSASDKAISYGLSLELQFHARLVVAHISQEKRKLRLEARS